VGVLDDSIDSWEPFDAHQIHALLSEFLSRASVNESGRIRGCDPGDYELRLHRLIVRALQLLQDRLAQCNPVLTLAQQVGACMTHLQRLRSAWEACIREVSSGATELANAIAKVVKEAKS
jgi:hypothetical protein